MYEKRLKVYPEGTPWERFQIKPRLTSPEGRNVDGAGNFPDGGNVIKLRNI